MKSTSCRHLAQGVLDAAITGAPPRELPRALASDACSQALFSILVEGLADRFEPALCDVYAHLFPQAIAHVTPGTDAGWLTARYERIRRPRPVIGKPHRVFVLSRVTLGADVAVTSVLLAAAKRRFPHAELFFAGPRKNYELFAGDPHIHHAPVDYHRGSLRDRLAVWEPLKALVSAHESVVIDPDSRLTQLGLLSICPESFHHLFESRSYGAGSPGTLSDLAAAWAAETFGIAGAKPYVALGHLPHYPKPYIAVSLGVGENAAKRLPDPFEEELFRLLAGTGLPLIVDKGAGGEEAGRVERAVEQSGTGAGATFWNGSFAGFARIIARARLYVGYDSAGQHVASANGVPLISIFAGFPVPRFYDRWRPADPHSTVVRVDRPDAQEVLGRVRQALAQIVGIPGAAAE